MLQVQRQISLSDRNTFRMDVTCGAWADCADAAALREVLARVADGRLPGPLLVVGGGSNLLFTGPFPGTVLHVADCSWAVTPSGDDVLVRVGAGMPLDDVCRRCAEAGWWGLENLSAIPGEAGGAAVQNAGAYGAETADALESVRCLDRRSGKEVDLPAAACGYAYRDSRFKRDWKARYIILAVTFRLHRLPRPVLDHGGLRSRLDALYPDWREDTLTPGQVRDAVRGIRQDKLPDPAEVGSAGSFFRNPFLSAADFARVERVAADRGFGPVPHFPLPDGRVKVPAAWLLDKCGLKGLREGGAGTWQNQPLVLVNADGHAAPADILRLEARLIETVRSVFGVTLEPEVEHIASSSL